MRVFYDFYVFPVFVSLTETAPRLLPCLREFKIEKKFLAGEAYSGNCHSSLSSLLSNSTQKFMGLFFLLF